MSAPTWTSLPQTPSVDAALRRAAAGVCWFTARCVHGCKEPEVYEGHGIHPMWIGDWLRNWNRDDLARVFNKVLSRSGKLEAVDQNYLVEAWWDSMDDPRYALCQLLDLLSIPPPPELAGSTDR